MAKATVTLVSFVLAAALLCGVPQVSAIATGAIDLGTEWLKIAVVKPGVPMEIALNQESQRKTMAAVGLRDDQLTFSDPAYSVVSSHPDKAFRYLLPLLGRQVDHPSVKQFQERFPYHKITADEERGTVIFAVNGVNYSVEELVGLILKHAAENGERFVEQPISQFVITVPPFFNQAQRRALLNAAKFAGIKVAHLINTNTAVALNFGIFRRQSFNETEQNYLFVDIGSQSTTATVVGYQTAKEKSSSSKQAPGLTIKGVGFDPSLGGIEFDFRIRDHLLKKFLDQKKTKVKGDITQSARAMSKLLKEAERIKRILSANSETVSQVEGLFEDIDFATDIKRAEFEAFSADLFERLANPIQHALNDAGLTAADLTQIIIVGGGVRIPKIQEILMKSLGVSELGKSLNGDEAAVLGAAFEAAASTTGFKVQPFLVKDSMVYPIEVSFDRESLDENNATVIKTMHRSIFPRHNVFPQKKSMTFGRFHDDFNFTVNYESLSFLPEAVQEYVAEHTLATVRLDGVSNAFSKNTGKTKGVKVHFSVDASGLFAVDKADVVFEPEEQTQSTFAAIRDAVSGFFGSSSSEGEKPTCEGEDCVSNESDSASTESEPVKTDAPKAETAPESDSETAKAEEKAEEKTTETQEETKAEGAEKEETKQEETQGEQSESKHEEATGEKTADENKEESTQDAAGKDAKEAEPAKPKETPAPKPKPVKENLGVKLSLANDINFQSKAFEAAKSRIDYLLAKEADRLANSAAKNALETFIYGTKEKLDSKPFKTVSTEEERTQLFTDLDAAAEWLYDEGFDASTETFKEKLSALNKTANPIFYRFREAQDRPRAVASLLESLNYTTHFLARVKSIPENETWYTQKEIQELETLANETLSWLQTTWAEQNATAPSVDPVMKVATVKAKSNRLDRELMFLAKKPRPKPPKIQKPKIIKPKNETETAGEETVNAEGESKQAGEESADAGQTNDEGKQQQQQQQQGDAGDAGDANGAEQTQQGDDETNTDGSAAEGNESAEQTQEEQETITRPADDAKAAKEKAKQDEKNERLNERRRAREYAKQAAEDAKKAEEASKAKAKAKKAREEAKKAKADKKKAGKEEGTKQSSSKEEPKKSPKTDSKKTGKAPEGKNTRKAGKAGKAPEDL